MLSGNRGFRNDPVGINTGPKSQTPYRTLTPNPTKFLTKAQMEMRQTKRRITKYIYIGKTGNAPETSKPGFQTWKA